MTLLERFEQKYIPEPNSGCWLWIGAMLVSRYGLMRRPKSRRWKLAHRLSYELHRDPIPEGLCVLHHCDLPCCVNPDHLFLGTLTDNHRDMVSKGRNGAAVGAKKPNAKLTDDMVREIRLSSGPSREVAQRFGVDHTKICAIRRGVAWRHVA